MSAVAVEAPSRSWILSPVGAALAVPVVVVLSLLALPLMLYATVAAVRVGAYRYVLLYATLTVVTGYPAYAFLMFGLSGVEFVPA